MQTALPSEIPGTKTCRAYCCLLLSRLTLSLMKNAEPRIGCADRRLGQPKLALDDVRATHDRHHLVERMQPAHSLPTEAAIGRDDQPVSIDVFQGAPDQIRNLLRPLHLQFAMAHDADRDLLALVEDAADVFEIRAVIVCGFERDDVDRELVEI